MGLATVYLIRHGAAQGNLGTRPRLLGSVSYTKFWPFPRLK